MKIVMALVPLLAAASSGCLPFASPPVKISIGGGGAFGPPSPKTPGSESTGPSEGEDSAELFSFRAAFSPLALLPAQRLRRFDVGLGYVFEGHEGTLAHHGGYGVTRYHPWLRPVGERSLVRLGVEATADMLWDRHGELGMGATLGLRLEFLQWNMGGFESKRTVGAAWGEAGLGFYVQGGLRRIGEHSWGTLIAGLSITLPVSAGLLNLH